MTSFISDSFHCFTNWVSECFYPSENPVETPEFQELTRRLKPKELAQTLEVLKRIPEKRIADIKAAISSSEWSSDPIFKNRDFPYFALAAVRQGKMSRHQFATVMNYWVKFGKEGRTARQLPLFHLNGSRNRLAENILRQHLVLRKDAPGQLSEKQFNDFYEKMKQAPASEQTLFLGDFDDALDVTEMTEDLVQIGFDLFYRHDNFLLLPSVTLFENYLAAKYPTSAVKLNPVLGLSSLEDIRQNGLTATRDVAVHFPGVELPEKADKNEAPGYAFTFHDYYHAATASAIPDKYRKNLVKISDVAKHLSPKPKKTFETKLSKRIIDMEATRYRIRADGGTSLAASEIYRKNPENFLFWNFLLANIEKSKYEVYSNPSAEDRAFIRKWVLEFPVDEGYREGVQDFLDREMASLNRTIDSLDEADPKVSTEQWRVKLHQEKNNHILHAINEAWKERLIWDIGIVQES